MADKSPEFVPGPKVKNEAPPPITFVDGPSAVRSEQKRNHLKEALSRLLGKHKAQNSPPEEPKAEVRPQIINTKTGQAVDVAVGMELLPKAEREKLLGIEPAKEGVETVPEGVLLGRMLDKRLEVMSVRVNEWKMRSAKSGERDVSQMNSVQSFVVEAAEGTAIILELTERVIAKLRTKLGNGVKDDV